MRLDELMTAAHVSANLVWVGGVLAASVIGAGPSERAKERAADGMRIMRVLATPAFVLSMLFGATRLTMDARHYLVVTHWMHAKLLMAALAIVAHHVILLWLRQGAQGKRGPVAWWAGTLFGVSAVAAAILGVLRPF